MQGSLAELLHDIAAAAMEAVELVETRQYERARELVRQIMGATGKLYPRLGFLAELEADAQFVAEVDRALTRERKSRNLGPIPGDAPLPFPPADGEASSPASGGKRKGRDTQKGTQRNQRP